MKIAQPWYEEPKDGHLENDLKYHKLHRRRPSFKLAVDLINKWKGCSSIIDVGCRSAGLLADVSDNYKIKKALDIRKPKFFGFDEKKVDFIHGDFLTVEVGRFDVVVCLETIEHIRPDLRRAFAQKLLQTAKKHLLISIPYMWQEDDCPVPHKGFNETHITEWFYPYIPDENWSHPNYYTAHFIMEGA